MTERQRKSQPRRNAEKRILDAAEEVFALTGYGGASMQQIAERADLPKANLHYYFSTKEDLYRQVMDRILTTWLAAAGNFDADHDPAEAIAAYIEAKLDLSRDRPSASKVFAAEIMQGAPVVQDFLEQTLQPWFDGRVNLLEQWASEGLIRPISPGNLLFMIWACTQHYADFGHQIETLQNGQPMDDAGWDRAKADVTALILGGLGLTPPRQL